MTFNSAPFLLRGSAAPEDFPDGSSLKRAMRNLAGGVTVITAGLGDRRSGATVTSAYSLSVDPPTMVVSLNLGSSTWAAVRDHGHFCVNILDETHVALANRFAGFGGVKGPARYDGADWTALVTGAPVLVGAVAAVDCEFEEAIERHSHALVLGRVRAVVTGTGRPLVYAAGQFGRFDN